MSAARDLDFHFHQLHEKDKARIEQRRYCSEEDVEVGWEEIQRSFELDSGKEVVITDEELASVEPRKTRTIDIEAFVDLAEVDPIAFDHPYFLVPAGDSEGTLRAYQLLVEAMGRNDRVALGRIVMRTKEYLVAVRVLDGALSLTTMLFHDEVRPTKGIGPGSAKSTAPAKKEVDAATSVIDAMTLGWDPSRYDDRHRKRLQKIIRDKKKGRKIKLDEPQDTPQSVPDLMTALEESLARAKKRAKTAA